MIFLHNLLMKQLWIMNSYIFAMEKAQYNYVWMKKLISRLTFLCNYKLFKPFIMFVDGSALCWF